LYLIDLLFKKLFSFHSKQSGWGEKVKWVGEKTKEEGLEMCVWS
jgi:hypothetical protein